MVLINKKIPLNPIVLGKIGSCYGIFGWMRMFSFSENIISIFNYKSWFIYTVDQWKKVRLETWRYYNQGLIIKLKGINDRTKASLLINCNIIVDSSQLPHLEKGNYYWKDLIGCQVITIKGYNFGKVVNIIETGSNDVLVIKENLKNTLLVKERLIPFLDGKVIKKIDLTSRVIEVDWGVDF